MDLEKIYNYRFRGIDQQRRIAAWSYIATWVMKQLCFPNKMLEVGAGRCEFINQCGAKKKYALDYDSNMKKYASHNVKFIAGKLQNYDVKDNLFDAIFMSNFLEHLTSSDEVYEVLTICFSLLKKGGKVGILGPNFKYAHREYFDCADHVIPLTHLSVEEHLIGVGFNRIITYPKFLPFSFRSSLSSHPILIKYYLAFPLAWKIMGKQFFIRAEK